ncbi:hypothetical protein R1flu_011441 [Riccia fluitans]|uniref:Uncharacterized protein n=1 Tax=Riccia fluitans TaxID=41844 RepID=A0ABD1Z902_9MARC
MRTAFGVCYCPLVKFAPASALVMTESHPFLSFQPCPTPRRPSPSPIPCPQLPISSCFLALLAVSPNCSIPSRRWNLTATSRLCGSLLELFRDGEFWQQHVELASVWSTRQNRSPLVLYSPTGDSELKEGMPGLSGSLLFLRRNTGKWSCVQFR